MQSDGIMKATRNSVGRTVPSLTTLSFGVSESSMIDITIQQNQIVTSETALDCIEIPLTKGFVAVIDAEDFERVSIYRWHASLRRNGTRAYAAARPTWRGGTIYMHRLIKSAPDGIEVDHRNRNTLDNRKENLRLCDGSINRMNSGPQANAVTSRYRGVHYRKDRGTWQARIQFRGRSIGRTFRTEKEAARFYNEKAVELMGVDAIWLNDV